MPTFLLLRACDYFFLVHHRCINDVAGTDREGHVCSTYCIVVRLHLS